MLGEKITALKKELVEFATLVECMLDEVINGLLKKDKGVLRRLVSDEEPKANRAEIHLDDIPLKEEGSSSAATSPMIDLLPHMIWRMPSARA